ncbi:Oidioi.mRNA.OKI2018_I69.XSR.g14112.t2.cds [Oikopleura dioica]|uniref:Oidioi.mRNA.OKI2018_I69.XSR.g14112.t2.cds n=1 Tax=Oikopleura dioica TaxID=34765 RepID=A0ABN7SF46_OIKDI|nr:Oidioi.mRNA.OKI2018_I69.XSR.g14112.t2.cds [Oikopleura dioica]
MIIKSLLLYGTLVAGFSGHFNPFDYVDYDYEEDSTPPPASIYDNLNKNPKAMKDLMRLKSAFTMYNLLEKNSKRSSPYLSSSNYE